MNSVVSFGQLRNRHGMKQARALTKRLRRVGRGWYANGHVDPVIQTALANGGRVACLSAVRLHGLWVPDKLGDHICVTSLGTLDGVTEHWVPRLGDTAVVSLVTALRQVHRWHSAEVTLMCLESAVDKGMLSLDQAQAFAADQPYLKYVRAGIQSGSETRVRAFLEIQGWHVRSQVRIAGVGRVDLLVGESLIIEVDSRAHHTGEENYERDRRRDVAAHRLGYRIIRLTYRQVFDEWDQTQQYLLAILRTRQHRRLAR